MKLASRRKARWECCCFYLPAPFSWTSASVVFDIVIMMLTTSITLKKRIMLRSGAAAEVAREMSIETKVDTMTPLSLYKDGATRFCVRDMYTEILAAIRYADSVLKA